MTKPITEADVIDLLAHLRTQQPHPTQHPRPQLTVIPGGAA